MKIRFWRAFSIVVRLAGRVAEITGLKKGTVAAKGIELADAVDDAREEAEKETQPASPVRGSLP